MDRLKEEIEARKQKLRMIVMAANKTLEHAVEGHLEVIKPRKTYGYVLAKRENGKHVRVYIKKADEGIARKIAQRDYALTMRRRAESEIEKLIEYEKAYGEVCIDNVYENLHPGRKLLVKPYAISDDEYAKIWQNVENPQENTIPKVNEFLTERGEIVRSKSEKLIADKLFLLNIPYRYEYAIKVGDKLMYPDFIVLNPTTRKEYVWEHLGMMDNEEYLEKNMAKLRIYERNGYVLGKNLICTFETSSVPISIQAINGIVEQFFM